MKQVIRTGCSPRYIALGKKVEEMLVSINIPRKNILTLPLARLPIERNIPEISKRKKGADKNVIFLFAGELTEIKGIDILLEAFKLASDRSTNLFLKIVGDGPMRVCCEKFIVKNKLNIKLSGRLDHDETLREISLSDILILPSRTESFGRVIVEAFEFEKAVIASRVGGVPQLIKDGENGILVKPCDPKGLAGAMLRLSKDNVLRERLGRNGKKSLEDLPSFDEVSGKILEFYGL